MVAEVHVCWTRSSYIVLERNQFPWPRNISSMNAPAPSNTSRFLREGGTRLCAILWTVLSTTGNQATESGRQSNDVGTHSCTMGRNGFPREAV